jgi:hypothetical protein
MKSFRAALDRHSDNKTERVGSTHPGETQLQFLQIHLLQNWAAHQIA